MSNSTVSRLLYEARIFPDPSFSVNSSVVLPIYLLGILLNGTIGLAVAVNRQKKLVTLSRVEKLAGALVMFCFGWSILSALKFFIFAPFRLYSKFYQTQALLACIAVLILFGFNLSLAIERYMHLRRCSDTLISRVLIFQWITLPVVLVPISWASYNVGFNGKGRSMEALVFIICITVAFAITLITTFVLYGLTYYQSRKELQKIISSVSSNGTLTSSQPGSDLEMRTATLNKKILVRCMLMNANTILCHVPLVVLDFLATFSKNDSISTILFSIEFVVMALEVIVTPVMVCYFFPQIRAVVPEVYGLLLKRQQKAQLEFELKEPVSIGRVEREPSVASSSQPGFHVIRVMR